jgi:hypothetical protein
MPPPHGPAAPGELDRHLTALLGEQATPFCIDRNGAPTRARLPRAVLPGSFNPAHAGHWGLADAAARHLGTEIDFELSVHNVDKPPLSAETARQRLAQFAGRGPLWLTRTPTFSQKAALFPGVVFVVGADTAARVVDPRYCPAGSVALVSALRGIWDRGCRFLVACRVDPDGQLLRLEDLHIPAGCAELFEALSPDVFRLDLSSTQLRAPRE